MSGEVEEDEERRRQRKLEEVLEVKSLRRIISAYLNYPEAAEEDVRRFERSFKKLSPAHKALLSHYPLKFQRLRRCISVNSYFIFNMLQSFEPPLDMSQDVDICEDPHLENFQHEHCHSEERNACFCQSASTSGRMCCSNLAQACSQERSNIISNPTAETTHELQEVQSGHQHETISGSCAGEVGNDKEIAECCGNDVTDSNGNVFSSPHDWLDPSLQLNVPLVDVDKVRCIIRNIVRDWAAEGEKERDQCYKPILEELDALFPNRSKESPPACLVPGAGLGRLALEISCLVLKQLENGQYILGSTAIAIRFQIMINFVQFQYLIFIRQVQGLLKVFLCVVGILLKSIMIPARLVWINLGPLLYHFADVYGQEDEMSIELSLEDVKKVALRYGFQFEKEQTIETTYTTNPRSMMQNHYFAVFWTLRKKRTSTT
ncbi:PREDICTED: uncharacterized protein LOC18612248 isoform X3 [Theobroma cacao]|uniref:Uncharacterized protein LOC18612248 isoform X3 n=1 Tax=Theobroma cacao TaxID=3641 RepID=A0AB32VU57_THECC|nr:PREDICTED: uncharacterized protein LOC18612248 isoform X3 [Theobroma cacao]